MAALPIIKTETTQNKTVKSINTAKNVSCRFNVCVVYVCMLGEGGISRGGRLTRDGSADPLCLSRPNAQELQHNARTTRRVLLLRLRLTALRSVVFQKPFLEVEERPASVRTTPAEDDVDFYGLYFLKMKVLIVAS